MSSRSTPITAHAECVGAQRDLRSDPAHADHYCRFTVQLNSVERTRIPDLLLVVFIKNVQIARKHQQHRERVIGNLRALDDLVICENDFAVA